MYERLLVEANVQLRVLALPQKYKIKHREHALRVAFSHFKSTYGVEPYKFLKQHLIQREQFAAE